MPLVGVKGTAARSRAPLWVWPALWGVVAAGAGWLLGLVQPRSGFLAALWPADTSAAAGLLQVVATSAVTITTLTFTVTVVALQLASQQFSPRLLAEFVRDRVTKAVLSILAGTFVFAFSGLRGVNSSQPVPTLVCLTAALLGIASLGALLAFITHMVTLLRVDTMMTRVHNVTDRAIGNFYPPHDEPPELTPDDLDLDPARGHRVMADGSGFVQLLHSEALVAAAQRHDAVVRIEARPGDHVTHGTPIATAFTPHGRPLDDELTAAIRSGLVLNNERTIDQDAAFGLRQLEDIAVKAMSPGINDPTTAATATGHMADLLVRLAGRHLGPAVHTDEDGVARLVLPDRDFRYYLDLACGQLARFGASEPTVLMALLRMLRDVAVSCRDDEQRAEVARAADLVVGELSPDRNDVDTAAVHDHRARVTAALEGRLDEAFADDNGRVRSM